MVTTECSPWPRTQSWEKFDNHTQWGLVTYSNYREQASASGIMKSSVQAMDNDSERSPIRLRLIGVRSLSNQFLHSLGWLLKQAYWISPQEGPGS
jgi:hypothetical protein